MKGETLNVWVVVLTTESMEVNTSVHASRDGAIRFVERVCKEAGFYDVRITEKAVQGIKNWSEL